MIEIVSNLSPSWQSGLTLTAKVYTGSTLAASIAMAELPAGSARYVAEFDAPAGVASYQWTAVDPAGNGVDSGDFTTNTAGADDSTPAPPQTLPSYLTLSAGDALAAAAGLRSYPTRTPEQRTQLLALATARVDASHRWQGRKFDCNQELEFPRIPYEGDSRVWDLDPATRDAVVPLKIKMAVIMEADSIAHGLRDRIAGAIDAGLTGQTTGSMSEQYRQAMAGQTGIAPLCREAEQFVAGYVLRSGRIL